MKKLIRLTEQDLHKIVNESVKRIINENNNYDSVMTDGSATYDGCPITEIYYDGGRICCADEEGAIGFLLNPNDFSEEEVWRILKSIR